MVKTWAVAHDFFQPQPQKNASVFLLKQITHDWSDEYCVKFLTRLWDAATPTTVLLLVDSVMPFACHDPSGDDDKGIPGAVPREAPPPLLANFGAVNEMAYNADIDVSPFLFITKMQDTTSESIDLDVFAVQLPGEDHSALGSSSAQRGLENHRCAPSGW